MRRVPIDPAGWPFLGGAVLLACASALIWAPLAWLFAAAAALFLFFFRDPERLIVGRPDAVLSPADGRVMVAGAAGESAPAGAWQQISIFLSPTDVHVNRIPASGRVTNVTYTPGKFLPAYRHDAARLNERSEIWIDHAGQPIVVRQIVGILARRVVCRATVGAEVRAGERYGVMKFGSRMDVFLPTSAEVRVEVGARVRAGETVIAVLH